MKTIRPVALAMLIAVWMPLVAAENAQSLRVSPKDAKDHIGDSATVCGKVMSTSVTKYGIAGHGKPVSFFLDQPESTAVFYFVTFGVKPAGPEEAKAAYEDKRVCVTGKIAMVSTIPFIMAADRSQIKVVAGDK